MAMATESIRLPPTTEWVEWGEEWNEEWDEEGVAASYKHLRAHKTLDHVVCRLLL